LEGKQATGEEMSRVDRLVFSPVARSAGVVAASLILDILRHNKWLY